MMGYIIKEGFIKVNHYEGTFKPQGMVIHETANPGATDEMHETYFNNPTSQASAHFGVDNDSITQYVPINEMAWHACYTGNHMYLGTELCRPKTHDPVYFNEVWKRGVWLFADVLKRLGISTVTPYTVPSHHEITIRYGESDHTDPDAYFAEYGQTVDGFRKAVQKCLDSGIIDDIEYTGGTTDMLLKKGSTGGEVAMLQRKLNVFGYELVEDGDFGLNTENAVKDFQSKHGLASDGIAGALFNDAMIKAIMDVVTLTKPSDTDKAMYDSLKILYDKQVSKYTDLVNKIKALPVA